MLRTPAQWAVHPQGVAVAGEPLIAATPGTAGPTTSAWNPSPARPLAGLRVLDLTRVLAGPVATRMLAGLGADVLRIDPPGWDEPGVVPDMTIGKHAARLDARDPAGRDTLLELLAGADLLVHGYRSDALERLGLGDAVRADVRPGLVDVALDAYGWSGPWRTRRGFDSLVQMSTGIAGWGLEHGTAERPTPLPVQALDHATGYLMAAAALTGLARRLRSGTGSRWRLSLARTALELERARAFPARPVAAHPAEPAPAPEPLTASVPLAAPLDTPWGAATLLPSPVRIGGIPLSWDHGPRELGSDAPAW
jgi:crotonobetainyl-CoA:carnitine CoA-transferase CaiB-like acyl-CoA transferase